MVNPLFPRVLVASLALVTAVAGCAHPRSPVAPIVRRPAPPPPPPPPPKKAKLVVLPLDKLALPGTAEEINAKLSRVKLPGADDAITVTTSMETVQLQSECAEPPDACYLKIAKLLEADRMLWAQVETAGKGKKKKKTSAKIEIVLFDAEKPGVVGRADETFVGPIASVALDRLIDAAVGVPGATSPAPPTTVTPPPDAPPPTAAPAPAAAQPGAPAHTRAATSYPTAQPPAPPAVHPAPVPAPVTAPVTAPAPPAPLPASFARPQ
jgi:hypothetical protein